MKAQNFSHSAIILPIQYMDVSIDFYCNKLGFELTFHWEDPITYAVLKRGAVSIHLTKMNDESLKRPKHTSLYIFVHDIELIYQECQNKGVTIVNSLGERAYHMQDFDIQDPDGHIITFGKGES